MAVSEYAKMQLERCRQDRKLVETANKRTAAWLRDTKVSHCMYVSGETLRRLEERGNAKVR